jgi:diacylglycerol kinase family enzyme
MAATHLLVGNPTAQSGKNAARIDRARAWLKDAGIACDFLPTEPEGRTIGAVTRTVDGGSHTCVVYMGGDGTFREVAAGILASKRAGEIAMGMLPTGTANDQGRSFGLEAGEDALEDNLRVIRAGNETRLDAGRITVFDAKEKPIRQDYFFDSAGWGISARVLAVRNQDRAAVGKIEPLAAVYRDQMVYAGALLKVFLESYVVSDKFTARIETERGAQELTGLTDLIVKGTRIYGGAWVFDKTSEHDDGLFEVVPFRGKRDWTSKAIVDLDGNPLTEELLNAIGIEHSKPFRSSRIDLRFEVPEGTKELAAQIDGEEYPVTAHARVEVLPRALRLIVP